MLENNSRTILFVEDEQQVRDFIRLILQSGRYEVITAVDGIDALEKARAHEGAIHLLLSDVDMPEMTGIELATQFTKERPETAILLMSGLPSESLVLNEGWQLLPKPFVPQMLKDKIASMLA